MKKVSYLGNLDEQSNLPTHSAFYFFRSVEVNAPAFLIDLFSSHSLYCSHINLTANFQHHIGFLLLTFSTGLRKHRIYIYFGQRYTSYIIHFCYSYEHGVYMFKGNTQVDTKGTHTQSYKRLDASVPLGIFNITELSILEML